MGYQAMAKVSEEQERRTAKAIAEGGDYTWSKAPNGWVCSTGSGGCYLVHRNACSCPDFQKRCCGTELRCKHIVALAHRLAEEEAKARPAVVADREAKEAARRAELDADFDRIFGAG